MKFLNFIKRLFTDPFDLLNEYLTTKELQLKIANAYRDAELERIRELNKITAEERQRIVAIGRSIDVRREV